MTDFLIMEIISNRIDRQLGQDRSVIFTHRNDSSDLSIGLTVLNDFHPSSSHDIQGIGVVETLVFLKYLDPSFCELTYQIVQCLPRPAHLHFELFGDAPFSRLRTPFQCDPPTCIDFSEPEGKSFSLQFVDSRGDDTTSWAYSSRRKPT